MKLAILTKWIAAAAGVCLVLSLAFYWIDGFVFWAFGNLALLGFFAAGLMTFWLVASQAVHGRR